VLDCRFCDLDVALVEVEGRVELALAHEQLLEARIVLERPVGLGLIVGQRFLQPLDLVPLIHGSLVEGAQRVFDTLHGADRIVGVDMRGVGARAPDEQVRHRCSRFVSAQDFEPVRDARVGISVHNPTTGLRTRKSVRGPVGKDSQRRSPSIRARPAPYGRPTGW
jgi:hypothetical protein